MVHSGNDFHIAIEAMAQSKSWMFPARKWWIVRVRFWLTLTRPGKSPLYPNKLL